MIRFITPPPQLLVLGCFYYLPTFLVSTVCKPSLKILVISTEAWQCNLIRKSLSHLNWSVTEPSHNKVSVPSQLKRDRAISQQSVCAIPTEAWQSHFTIKYLRHPNWSVTDPSHNKLSEPSQKRFVWAILTEAWQCHLYQCILTQ